MSRETSLFLALLAGLLLLACVLWSPPCTATVRVAWNASERATEYHIYYGEASGSYAVVLPVGPVLAIVIDGLTPGVTYYFAATASNAWGESGYSNEVAWTEPVVPPPPPPPAPPPQLHIVTPTSGQAVARRSTVLITVALDSGGPVTQIDITVDQAGLCTDATAPYSCPWDVPAANRRTYQLQARALDVLGQVGLSPVVEVTAQ